MNGWGLFFLLLLLLVIIPAVVWVAFTRYRAHRAGLPPPPLSAYNPFNRNPVSNYPPAPRPSGVVGWVQDKLHSLRNSRSAGGAYEGGRTGRSFGPLDPDGAWDTRVGNEADAYGPVGDYEEQELGLHPPPPGAYGGSGYGAPSPSLPPYGSEDLGRGRSRSREGTAYIGGSQRELDQRYEEEMTREDPFGDEAERSSLAPANARTTEQGGERGHAKKSSLGGTEESPTERKSMFREQM